jgi:serine/threonine protein kinase
MIEYPSCDLSNADINQQCKECTSPLLSCDPRCGLYTYGGTSMGQVLQMRYAIIRELNSDITGVKYLAEDVEGKKDVIIWALPLVAGTDKEKMRSFSELCNNLKELANEHIVNVLGFYPEKNVRYAVTEHVDGCTLEERVASDGPLNIETVLEIFGPIAQSLDIVHKQGFIHGDISPANILISSKGVVKLANFAIGKAIKEMLALLLPEEDIKPSFYTAPEQSENAICSAQSDIYSLAACIYYSLSEEHLSRPDQQQLHELKHKPGRLDRLSEKQNEVLRKSLSVNPQYRHSSAVELLKELQDSSAEIDIVKNMTTSEDISYEKSLAGFKQRTQDWNKELEDAINKLMIDAEREKQKHAEILCQAQIQARQWAEQLRADYEGKTEQLKAKIEEAQAKLAAVVSEVNRKTEALVSEKEKALQQSKEHEEAINKLIAEAEQEKQKHAELLSNARAQVREQAEQQLADYEEKIVQLKAKITDIELAAVAAMGQTNCNTEALVSEKEKALQQSRELEETINKLRADAEQEKQKHAELLSNAQVKVKEQPEQQLVDDEGKIKQLEARITESEAKLAAAVSEANQKTEALVSEKEKALQRSRELEETVNKLRADAEQEEQILAETLSHTQTQASEQTEQQQADYDEKIKQLEARITESEAKLAAAVSEANQKTEALVSEKEKALQRSRELEETVNKLRADAEQEKQILAETLSHTQTLASEQTEQQQADYDEKIKQLEAKTEEAQVKLTSAVSEANQKNEALVSEKEKALQRIRELEETINKIKAEAEQEKQRHAELLRKAQVQVSEPAQQQLVDYEKKIKQLEARIAGLEEKLAAVVSESRHNAEELFSEKKKALQQSMKYEETLEKVKAEAQQQQKQYTEQLNQAQRKRHAHAVAVELVNEETVNTSSRSKISVVTWILVSIIILGIVTGYLYITAKPVLLTGSTFTNYLFGKGEAQNTAPRKTYSQLYREAVILEGEKQWEKAIATYKKAMEINKNPRVVYKVKMCHYNLYLSQAIKARHAKDLDKAVELYGQALTYYEDVDVRREFESLKKMGQLHSISQEWLKPSYDFK